MEQQRKSKEEEVVVLDFLPNGYPFDSRPSHRKTPIVQVLGKKRFTLLELVPKKDVFLQPNQEVYIGDGKRDQIHHILGKLAYAKLTSTAKSSIEYVLKDLIKERELDFIEFFNTARPLTTRMHQLELLPGLGKKHMWAIIEERKGDPFKNFEDLKSRVKLIPDPEKILLKRLVLELEEKEKYKLFVD
ncbi:DUF655 domain-containing protein [Candidatus Woesearchaeota archaeon]|jgi:putative nucleotide binding protein|nr:DUF655 domain-containing protein [Candidatus Woesearchaeota archaeon]MBT6519340.1 DUF655 domain-containing protein [Candidatus Woesearchaeota archaeon]MBT7366800.1 DUF655 domain-containing protein [Candidatus Woesearchaeota archaeon]